MGQDMPPAGRFASAADIEAWVDRQAPLVAVVNGAIVAAGLGEPWHRFGPAFVRAGTNAIGTRRRPDAAHLRLGATWDKPRAGIRVNVYGAFNRLLVWNHEWRRIFLDSAETDPLTLAADLWEAMLSVQIPAESTLPYLKDPEGNIRAWCRLGCDLQITNGRLWCSCHLPRR